MILVVMMMEVFFCIYGYIHFCNRRIHTNINVNFLPGLKYRLFVICGSDNENRSTFVSSLDKFVRNVVPTNVPQLKKYVCHSLIALNDNKPKAAEVDFQR